MEYVLDSGVLPLKKNFFNAALKKKLHISLSSSLITIKDDKSSPFITVFFKRVCASGVQPKNREIVMGLSRFRSLSRICNEFLQVLEHWVTCYVNATLKGSQKHKSQLALCSAEHGH